MSDSKNEKKPSEKPAPTESEPSSDEIKEGRDYYLENGYIVFLPEYHLRRGYCCNSGCRHCPYKGSSSK